MYFDGDVAFIPVASDSKISELHKKARYKLTALSVVFVVFFCSPLAFCLFDLTIK